MIIHLEFVLHWEGTAKCLCVFLQQKMQSLQKRCLTITPELYFLPCIDLYLPLTLNHGDLAAGSEAQYLYLQFPLIIGFWEWCYRSATHAAIPPASSPETWQPTERSLGCCKWTLLLPQIQKKAWGYRSESFFEFSTHIFFFVLFYPSLFLGAN